VILVVNPNPALDRVAAVHFRRGATLRPVRFSTWAGGSGVHAAHVAHMLGAEVLVQGFVAGHTGALFRDHLAQDGLAADLVEMPGETRQTYSLLDVAEGNLCDVAEAGPQVPSEAAAALEARALARIPAAELLIISGSLPAGCPATLPATLAKAARAAGVPCIADLAGALLLDTLPARPWLIKPSRAEIAELLGRATVDVDDLIPLARRWVAAGADNVCVSLDALGLLWVTADNAWRVRPPEVPAFNSIGCGDTLVGALAATYVQTHDLAHAVRAGVAAAAANLQYDAPGHCTRADVDRLIGQVALEPLATAA
jgi:tagatose 6-phosphate kinase